MKDLVYIVNKQTLVLSELGEIQTGFNMSFVIDGTKDSAKIEVYNFDSKEVEPWSIIKHELTGTWFVATHDKVERYNNENGFLYKHILTLNGAIELLNARDLTDCGFNQNDYTIDTFFSRLLKLSNFSASFTGANIYLRDNGVISKDKVIDYVKTFENYTLLSALRELFDGYNCSLKMSFGTTTIGTTTKISNVYFDVISKTGNVGTPLLESKFTSVKETKTIDKNSYGSTVVSNAENVISTQSKLFPTIGTVKLSSEQYTIDRANACLRLPSDVYKVNWLQMVVCNSLSVTFLNSYRDTPVIQNDEDLDGAIEILANWGNSLIVGIDCSQEEKDDFLANVGTIAQNALLSFRTTFYTGWTYDPIADIFHKPTNLPVDSNYYIPAIQLYEGLTTIYRGQCVIGPKENYQGVQYKDSCIYYETGNDLIRNFAYLGSINGDHNSFLVSLEPSHTPLYYSTDLRQDHIFKDNLLQVDLSSYSINIGNARFRINYVPMSDLKIKYDNNGDSNDIQLYNQNGKLTDSVALSKSLLSYSKQIESDNITKYANFYAFEDAPKVGDTVNIGNDLYVINNVSLDFYPNEINGEQTDNGYYIVGEFTMSKKIAVKSLMVNPNTEIRDYGIPQNHNVKRKQLYRDFYEFSRVNTISPYDPYLSLTKILNVEPFYQQYQQHIAVVKLTFDQAYGGGGTYVDNTVVQPSDNWYYQLETTTYVLKKSIYEIVDFKDNNIIGYGSQNVISGFDFSRVLTGRTDTINTPISYVDENGRVKDIEIAFSTIDQVLDTYNEYIENENYILSDNYNGMLYNYSVFIPSDIYEGNPVAYPVGIIGAKNPFRHDFMIKELYYNKDPIEVPVFEYSCQIDDSEEVIVGDDIFCNEEAVFFYYYDEVYRGTINENNWNNLTAPDIVIVNHPLSNHTIYTMNKGVKIEFTDTRRLKLTFYSYSQFDKESRTFAYAPSQNFVNLTNKDLVISRYRFVNGSKVETINGVRYLRAKKEMIFIIKGNENDTSATYEINLIANHYKIK